MKILFISISSVILCSIGEFVDDVNFVVSDDDQSEEEFLNEDPNNVCNVYILYHQPTFK